jgi:D-alanyl-D-alanine carboxypeptidase
MGNIVMVANPHAFNPLMEASEVEIIGRDKGRIVLAAGYQSYGEPVRRSRSKSGATTEIWLSSIRLRPESKVGSEMKRRYSAGNRPAKGRKGPAPH